jgi:hypothetical protein
MTSISVRRLNESFKLLAAKALPALRNMPVRLQTNVPIVISGNPRRCSFFAKSRAGLDALPKILVKRLIRPQLLRG